MTREIGLFGGTFNPPHRGHIRAAVQAAEQLGLAKVLLMPTAQPPHKELPEDTAAPEDRLAMLRLAAAGEEKLEVSELELLRGGVSYTADTVEAILAEEPGACVRLLMGDDMLHSLESWCRFDYLAAHVRICALSRYGDGESREADIRRLRRDFGLEVTPLAGEPLEISSTELRALLRQRQGREYLAPEVYAYIQKHRLYGARPDFAWLREEGDRWLKPKRIPHVRGCEEEAVRLALRWGADPEDAREAAILHDITKRLDENEQLLLCEKYGIITDNAEKAATKLLHAKTGAAVAEHEFGLSPRVCSAIRWHTTGRADMSLLEKILYLADYIEPCRSFEGVEPLRKLCYEDLDAAMLLGLEMSVEEIRARGETPYYRTLEAVEHLKRR